jgi:hypothetical protein
LAKETTEFGVPEGDGVTLLRGLGAEATGDAQPDSRVERPTTSNAASFTRYLTLADSADGFSTPIWRIRWSGGSLNRE